MRASNAKILLLVCLATICHAATSRADGGTLQRVERHGDVQVALFTAPNPLRAGTVDISLLAQHATTGEPLAEIEARVTLTPIGRDGLPVHAPLLRANATNRLMQSALVELPEPGEWRVQVEAKNSGHDLRTEFTVNVGPPLPRWLSEWPWFCWPALAVALFGVHRYRVSCRTDRRRIRA
ncbi:MAG: hypothetical protein WD845_07660 [Pirellulales bacterium]